MLNKSPENSDFVLLVILKIETIVLRLPQLIVVIVKSFLSQTHFGGSSFKRIESFAIIVNLLIEFTPIFYIFHGVSDWSFFNFFLGLSILSCPRACLFLFCCNVPISDFDSGVQKKLIFKCDYLFEWEKPQMYIVFACKIKIEDVAVVEVETWIRSFLTHRTDR